MARVVYLDCFSGIAGDMFIGACLDAGLPFAHVQQAIGGLLTDGAHVHAHRVMRAGIGATHFSVHDPATSRPAGEHVHAHAGAASHRQEHHGQRTGDLAHGGHHHHDHDGHAHTHGSPGDGHSHAAGHGHRTLPEIFTLLDRSALSASARARTRQIFERLAEAEAAIHQTPIERVHLHEVGALDSIVDIAGAAVALEWLAADRIICSPLNVGGGFVNSAHGRFPVPAPATLRLLDGVPIYAGTVQNELVTPTGAAIVTSCAAAFGPVPALTVRAVGYGAGSRDNPQTPNVLRVIVGDSAEADATERVAVIECEIDDMNPQLFGVAMDRLYQAGALEVFYAAVQMKKNRPGTLLTVIASPSDRQALTDIVFRETTTIGVRHTEVDRTALRRDVVTIATALGPIRVKQAWHEGRVINAVPEFEDCAALARTHGVAVKDVQAMAVRAYGSVDGGRA